MVRTKAYRIHHQKRMEAKARKYLTWTQNPEHFANHMKICSCPTCGNPRKWFNEKTMQERKADQNKY